MSQILTAIQSAAQALRQCPWNIPPSLPGTPWRCAFLFPILAVAMLARVIRSLVKASPKPEIWAYLSLPNGVSQPLTHWENILGRSASCDGVLNYPVVSRQHAALIRGEDDVWTVYDLGSKSGTMVNGAPADPAGSRVNFGDVVSLGGVETVLLPVPDEEVKRRRKVDSRPVSPWGSLVLLTLLQVLTALQFLFSEDEEYMLLVSTAFLALSGIMWIYCLVMRGLGRIGFEIETIAVFPVHPVLSHHRLLRPLFGG